jgi:hypothetical protein
LPTDSFLYYAGQWLLRSGIQEPNGGVARYYLADVQRNKPVSTEITGYTVSALVYLHKLTGEQPYLDRAVQAAQFLTRTAWRPDLDTVPFETEPTSEGLLGYFFDAGIVARGLLAVWRATGDDEFLACAFKIGRAMARDYRVAEAGCAGQYHPIVRLPGCEPLDRDLRWSRSAGCYQLKSAMAWCELAEATGDTTFQHCYDQVLEFSLRTYTTFLPGHPERLKVMDRLHAFSYFLEGMLPRATDERCTAALADGIGLVAYWLREIGPQFDRADVYAQLLRARIYADWVGVVPLDREAAKWEAGRLREFQHSSDDKRIDGGFYFGRRGKEWLPYVNPVSTAFALQALAQWQQVLDGAEPGDRHQLI